MTRSLKKGPYIDNNVVKKIKEMQKSNVKQSIKTWARSCTISPEMINLLFKVHNGKTFVDVYITESMVGHKLGEFALTRTWRMHSGQRQMGMKVKK